MDSFLHDLRFGARILLRSPGITIAIIFALTLGIGANSAMFSVVDGILLHPVNYRDPVTLVMVWDRDGQGVVHNASAANYLDWRAKAKSFSDLAGWRGASYVITGGDRPEQVNGATVTANFFRTLGVKPTLGRTFLAEEDGIDDPARASKVAVIGYRTWQENLGADPNVLGRTIRLNSVPYVIIGVMPLDFHFMSSRSQVWVPVAINRQNRDFHYLTVIARLNAARPNAIAEMSTLAQALGDEYPKTNKGWTIQVDDFQEWLVDRGFRTRLLLLFGAVGMVLMIACANVASLLMARAAGRNREIAVRISVGATRFRLTRQLLTESALLSLAGGALGLGLAALFIHAAPSVVPPIRDSATGPIELNFSVALFTLVVAMFTGILFGLAPALGATRPDVQETLKESSRGSTAGRGRRHFHQLMVTGEVAVALMLLASAGLMIESLRKLYDVNLGFEPANVLRLRVYLPTAKYDPVRALEYHRQALDKIASLPGVKSVAVASNLPLVYYSMEVPFDLESSPMRAQGERPGVGYISVSTGYMKTLGIPLKNGRVFTEADSQTAPPVVIVNDAFAARYFPRENPVGKRLLLNRPILGKNIFEDTIRPEIVGVIGNVKMSDLAAQADPIVYVPEAQNIWSSSAWFVVKSTTDPAGLIAAIRNELMQLDSAEPIDQPGTFDELYATRFAEPRFQTELMGAFAAVALLLAVVGIYGVNAYAVTQRRHEIGVRMALGATSGDVLRATVAQGMRMTAVGIVVGLIGAAAVGSMLKSVLVGVSGTDPLTLAGVAILLALVGAAASYIPARRATKIDPAVALREQ
jgi:putative ABC transport system permease protein